MSLRWRRRTFGRKLTADAALGAMREETQKILAWRRKLPTEKRGALMSQLIVCLHHAFHLGVRVSAGNQYEGEPHIIATPFANSVRINVEMPAYKRKAWPTEWNLPAMYIPKHALKFVVAALELDS